MSRKPRLIVVIIIVAVGWIFLDGLIESGPGGGGSGDSAATRSPEGRDPDSYAMRPLANTWPAQVASSGVTGQPLDTVNYYLVLDGSGSMGDDNCSAGQPKINTAVAAVKTFISVVPKQANLGLAVFDRNGLSQRVPLGAGNRKAFMAQLDRVRADSGTPLRSSMKIAVDALSEQARRQLGYGEYHLVVVTDGYADPRSEEPGPLVEAVLRESPVVVHVIGFCIGEQHSLNQPGRTLYTSADSPQALQQGLSSVLAESPTFDVADFPQP